MANWIYSICVKNASICAIGNELIINYIIHLLVKNRLLFVPKTLLFVQLIFSR